MVRRAAKAINNPSARAAFEAALDAWTSMCASRASSPATRDSVTATDSGDKGTSGAELNAGLADASGAVVGVWAVELADTTGKMSRRAGSQRVNAHVTTAAPKMNANKATISAVRRGRACRSSGS